MKRYRVLNVPVQNKHDSLPVIRQGTLPNKVTLTNEVMEEHILRDSKIDFIEEGHKYIIDKEYASRNIPDYIMDMEYTSTTTVIKHFFPKFQEEFISARLANSDNKFSKYYGMTQDEIKKQWKDIGDEARTKGTAMHLSFEYLLLNNLECFSKLKAEHGWAVEILIKELKLNYKHLLDYNMYRSEWRIFDEYHYICGSIDCILSDPKNTHFIIIDWKRSKGIKMDSHDGKECGDHVLTSKLKNCNFIHYSIQLNVYRHIIETRYKVPVLEMYIANMNPKNKKAEIYKVPKMTTTVSHMFKHMKEFKIDKYFKDKNKKTS